MIKTVIKKFVPNCIWSKIRRRAIINEQLHISKLCDNYIIDYFDGKIEKYVPSPKKRELVGKKIIWQYWAQGFDDNSLPEIVKYCLSSVDKHKGDCVVVRLSDHDISDYIDLPDFMYSKRGDGFKNHSFANVLRLALLFTYGGLWLDATVLLTDTVPDKYFQYDFFLFQRDESEPHKKYWENTFALYFGWGDDFIVRMLTSIIYSQPGSKMIGDWMNMMVHVWRVNDKYPFYFIFPVMYNQLLKYGKSGDNCPIEGDCLPHYLMQIINDDFPYATAKEAAQLIAFHKLSYKNMDVAKVKKVLSDIGYNHV